MGDVEGERSDDAGRADLLGGSDGVAQLLEARLGLDQQPIDARFDERCRLFGQRLTRHRLRYIAVGLDQSSQRPDVTEHEAGTVAEGLARLDRTGAIDRLDLGAEAVSLEHDAAGPEGIGGQAVGPGINVGALDGEHLIGTFEVPALPTSAGLQTGPLQLGPHRPVGEQHSIGERLQQARARHAGLRPDPLPSQARSNALEGARPNAAMVDRTGRKNPESSISMGPASGETTAKRFG